VRPKAS